MSANIHLSKGSIFEIARQYGLTISGYRPLDGGASNTSYLLNSTADRYVLTIFEDKNVSEACQLGQLLKTLTSHHFPTTPVLLTSNSEVAILHKKKPIMLKKYIPGKVCEQLDAEMLHQSGKMLAELHQIPAPGFLPKISRYGRKDFSNAFGRNIDTGYEKWLGRELQYLNKNIPLNLPRGLIHGDLFYHNLLFLKGKLKAMIDFEFAAHYFKVFDLGITTIGLCSEDSPNIQFAKAKALIAGYQQIRQLTPAEKDALQFFVCYAATTISYWRFWKYHIHSPRPDRATKHRQMVRLIEHVRQISALDFYNRIFCEKPIR